MLFFTCRDYVDQPEWVQKKIDNVCDHVSGGEKAYKDALFGMLTTRESVTALTMRHCVSATKLYDMRRRFYENWYK